MVNPSLKINLNPPEKDLPAERRESLSNRIQRARTSVRDCRQLPLDAKPRLTLVPRRRRAWPETATLLGAINL